MDSNIICETIKAARVILINADQIFLCFCLVDDHVIAPVWTKGNELTIKTDDKKGCTLIQVLVDPNFSMMSLSAFHLC